MVNETSSEIGLPPEVSPVAEASTSKSTASGGMLEKLKRLFGGNDDSAPKMAPLTPADYAANLPSGASEVVRAQVAAEARKSETPVLASPAATK